MTPRNVTVKSPVEYTNVKGDRIIAKKGEEITVTGEEHAQLKKLGVLAKPTEHVEQEAKKAEPQREQASENEAVGAATKVQATSKAGGK